MAIATHKMSHTRLYRKIWLNIRQRTSNPKTINYRSYGGKGIRCEWSSFNEFYRDMGESYHQHCAKFGEKQTQIDRINNNNNYAKENCRWVTPAEQRKNKGRNYVNLLPRVKITMNTQMNPQEENQTEPKDLDILWTVEQTAKYLSIHPGTVYNWIGKKKVLDPTKLVRFSNRVRIPRSEVMRIAGVIKVKLKK